MRSVNSSSPTLSLFSMAVKAISADSSAAISFLLFGPEAKRSEKVAVLGAGPAGLSAAWQLALRGYKVSLYEREERLGGKIYYCIPEDRLPRDILQVELDRFAALGISVHAGAEVDKAAYAAEDLPAGEVVLVHHNKLVRFDRDKPVWTFYSHGFNDEVLNYLTPRWPLDYGAE